MTPLPRELGEKLGGVNIADILERIERATEEHDAMIALCPVNNPKRGRTFRPDDTCPRCQAKASESCGLASGAGYHLAAAIRQALAKDPTP